MNALRWPDCRTGFFDQSHQVYARFVRETESPLAASLKQADLDLFTPFLQAG
jgi:hypothetical protein